MAVPADQVRLARRVAGTIRQCGPDSDQARAARADLTEARAEAHMRALAAIAPERAASLAAQIREEVAGWPPLTEAQRQELALLLNPGDGYDRSA